MSGIEAVGFVRTPIEWTALFIELLAVAVIVAGVLKVVMAPGTIRYLFQPATSGASERYRHQLVSPLLLGLDFLVAGDVVRTVALEPSLMNIAVLGLLVVVRTFLSWSLAVELEGCWPWQVARTRPKDESLERV